MQGPGFVGHEAFETRDPSKTLEKGRQVQDGGGHCSEVSDRKT